MKYKKYKQRIGKFGKKLFVSASSSIVAGMLIMGTASTAFAETTDYSSAPTPAYTQNAGRAGMHMMHRWNSDTKIASLALQLGLDPSEIKSEIKSGKSLKQVLQDNGIVPGQIQKAFESAKK